MTEVAESLSNFVEYAESLDGYEKGEAQLFCERFFQAFGHPGLNEIGAKLEFQVRKSDGSGIKFADLLWRPRVLIEMKSRGEQLHRHVRQAFDYWINLVPDRPSFVVLCNFDEFWIYDFNVQLDSPVDQVSLQELPERYTAFGFLFPHEQKPLFGNDKVAVTREAADKVAAVFNSLVERGESRESAQRHILQCVVAMFAEDFDLLPKDFFSYLLTECAEGGSSYDLVGGLFRQMALEEPARGGRYEEVRYFNGGLFDTVHAMEFTDDEVTLLQEAASENWQSVAPPIFGTIFQSCLDQARRHASGAHFTREADIQKIVGPTIVAPWRARIAGATTLRELEKIRDDLLAFRVLDPACGSGNFLYIAYRELVNLEIEVLARIHEEFGERARRRAGTHSLISTKNFFGLDTDPFAVELAKVTLMIGKRIALAETKESPFAQQRGLDLEFEEPLPLDNLDENIRVENALFCDWPEVDAIIGNPPFQSKNKIVQELGREYVDSVRALFPDVSGRADYCVYWFRRAHEHLNEGQRAGLVGTNTIRQNFSREGGLDYIIANGGTITEAVSTQVWPGDAVVHVSILNWIKGEQDGPKKLFVQAGDNLDSPWEVYEIDQINAALSPGADVTQAQPLECSGDPKTCYQGQTHGHVGFLIAEDDPDLAGLLDAHSDVIHPFLTANDLLGPGKPSRWVIDLNHCQDVTAAMQHGAAFERVRRDVMPDILEKAAEEGRKSGRTVGPRQNHARTWWKFWRSRPELMSKLQVMNRYVVCGRVTKRPVFVFVSTTVHPNDALMAFTFDDDYSFGILQSDIHWHWFTERCSTLKGDFRYTNMTVYDSFPWPQRPSMVAITNASNAARELRALRHELTQSQSLRSVYRSMELPGRHRLKDAHAVLDAAVREAYGMAPDENPLEFVFDLNRHIQNQERNGEPVERPGLPSIVSDSSPFASNDVFVGATQDA